MTKIKFYWHLHHDRLVESLTKPIKNRIEYIKKHKPKETIKLRLKLLKPVKGKLPKELIGARKKYDEVWKKYNEAEKKHDEAEKKYNEAEEKYYEAWGKYNEAGKKYKPQILALHKKECPNCPWDEKQQTIFPK